VLKQGREEACAAVLELGLSARRRSAGFASTGSNRRGLGAGGEGRGWKGQRAPVRERSNGDGGSSDTSAGVGASERSRESNMGN
jgi:hypothetical protein